MSDPGPDKMLPESIHTGQLDHAGLHNDTNDQVNWLTSEVGIRLAASAVAAQIGAGVDAALANYDASGASPLLPTEPVLLGSVTDSRFAGATGLAVSTDGRYAYLTIAAANQFLIVDMVDPLNPIVVASLVDAVNMPSPYRIAVTGTYAVVTCNQRVAVVNCATPAAPTVASTASNSNLGNIGGGHVALAADGNTAYVSYPSGNRVSVVNITNKAAPAYVATLQENTHLAGAAALRVLSTTRIAAACTTSDSVSIINVSNPAAPAYVTKVTDAVLDGAQLMSRNGRWLYVTTGQGRGVVVDVDTPDSPVLKGSVLNGSFIAGINDAIRIGTLVLGTTYTGGLWRWDATDPNAPVVPAAGRTIEAEEVFGQSSAQRALLAVVGTKLLHVAADLKRLNIFGPPSASRDTRRATVAMIGDSLTRMNGSGTSRNATRGWVTWANLKNGQKYRLLHNGGSDGQTSTQILARAWIDLTVFRPAIAHILAGTNDLSSSSTANQIVANIRQLVRLALDAGSRVVVATIPARTISPDVGGVARTKMNAVNAGIRDLAATTDGVTLADYFAALDSGDGTPSAGTTYDGLHLTALGASVLGPVFATAVETALSGLYVGPGRVLSPVNQAPNGALTGTGGTAGAGASGDVADSTTITNAVASKPTANTQKVVVGASTTSTVVQTAAVTAGDVIVGEVTLDAATFALVTRFNLKLVAGSQTAYDLSPVVAGAGGGVADDTTANPVPSPGADVTLRTFPIIVPAGTTTAPLTVTLTTGAAGSAEITLKSFRVASLVVA